ncbi:hypothetical protein B0T25DRAFT_524397 [Lasiosphaeria hispida]|uniref:Uncharacterized protein n=1 Tax=Lasiosphaeria hispida TaxID=260671 RepID=A0AAJ0HT90_9PEZI|nr:hypothetical protein B0T25DRAFT_524397 [Lasiosphaeria hispida]
MSGRGLWRAFRGEQNLDSFPEYRIPLPPPAPPPRLSRLFRRSLRNSPPSMEPTFSSIRYENMSQGPPPHRDNVVSPSPSVFRGWERGTLSRGLVHITAGAETHLVVGQDGSPGLPGPQISTSRDIPRNPPGTTCITESVVDECHERKRSTEIIQIGLAVTPNTAFMPTFENRAPGPLECFAYGNSEMADPVQDEVAMGGTNPQDFSPTTYVPVVRPPSSFYSSMYETDRPSTSDDESALAAPPAEAQDQFRAQDPPVRRTDRYLKSESVTPEAQTHPSTQPTRSASIRYVPPIIPAPRRFVTLWQIEPRAEETISVPANGARELIVPRAPPIMPENGPASTNTIKSRRRSMIQSISGWWDTMSPWESSEDKLGNAGGSHQIGRLRHVHRETGWDRSAQRHLPRP